jgi:hypothetical protein
MREHTLLKLHASATGMTCLPPARPGHLLRSGGSGLGRDGAAYPSYRLICCETTVCRVTDCLWCPSGQLSDWLGSVVGNQSAPHPLQLFLVESLRSLSPYQERSIAQLSKELTGSQPSSSTDYPVNKVSHLKVCRTDLYTSSEVNPCFPLLILLYQFKPVPP